jgi:hypothetical protein
LIRGSAPSVKAEQIANFLGRQITPLVEELGIPLLDPDRRDLHQASVRSILDQDIRQVRLRAAGGIRCVTQSLILPALA